MNELTNPGRALSPAELKILERQVGTRIERFIVTLNVDGSEHELTILERSATDAIIRALDIYDPETEVRDIGITARRKP